MIYIEREREREIIYAYTYMYIYTAYRVEGRLFAIHFAPCLGKRGKKQPVCVCVYVCVCEEEKSCGEIGKEGFIKSALHQVMGMCRCANAKYVWVGERVCVLCVCVCACV